MNRLAIKNLFIFVVGGLIGTLATHQYFKTKYADLADEEIASVIQYYQNFGKELDAVVDELDKERKEKSEETYTNYAKAYNERSEKKDLNTVLKERGIVPVGSERGLTKPVDLDAFPEDDEAEDDDEEYEHVEVAHGENSIYPIPSDAFSNENLHYDKLSITYYDTDNVLTDSHDEIIDNINDLVGPDALKMFGDNVLDDPDFDPNIVFVRNNNVAIDFEIVKAGGSFAEMVLGIEPSPKVESTHKPVVSTKTRKPRTKSVKKDGEV